jgi:benzylsuccinate CoA-transferase BbsF subunit
MSGLAHLTGYADRGPMQPANYYCDYNAGALAAFATIAALRHQARTGEGQHVELAMLEGELQVVGEALLDYEMNARVQQRTGNAHIICRTAYPCAR